MKPDDIPQSVWDRACKAELSRPSSIRGCIGDIPNGVAVLPIARAILAAVEEEREACAQTVERDGPQRYYNMHGQARGLSELEAHLASAIRNR